MKTVSGKYFTISTKRSASSGTFVERAPSNGKFVVRTMNGQVFEQAEKAANSKLRDVTGKFLVQKKK